MKPLFCLCYLLLVGLLLAGCSIPNGGASVPDAALTVDPGSVVIATSSKLLGSSPAVPQVGDPAPDFEYTLADGTVTRLSDLRGKKVLINFWATWCAPCRLEMPALQEASLEYADAGLVVLGVNLVESPNDIVPFGNEFGITFPLITNRSGDIRDAYAAQNIPTSYFINSDGTIADKHLGVIDVTYIAERLAEMN